MLCVCDMGLIVCTWEDQWKLMSYFNSILCLWKGFSLNLERGWQTRKLQPHFRLHTSWYNDCRHIHPLLAFHMGAGDLHSAPWTCSDSASTHWAIFNLGNFPPFCKSSNLLIFFHGNFIVLFRKLVCSLLQMVESVLSGKMPVISVDKNFISRFHFKWGLPTQYSILAFF